MTQIQIEDIYTLSPMQQGMLFHTLYDADSGVYCEQTILTFKGFLDSTILARAWRHVVQQHPILRTAFVWQEVAEPVQAVWRQVALPLRQEDWRHLPADAQAERLEAFLEGERRRGFDLAQAPLMRLALLRTAVDSYQFVWSFHHLLLDGWSVPLLLPELFACYRALRNRESWRPPARRPYRDYIAWLQQQKLAEAEAYWRAALAGFTVPTPFQVDEANGTASQDGLPGQQQLQLSKAETAALQSLARAHNLTLNTLVQGAWTLLLSRYSGENDVVFGATVSGRPPGLAGVEEMIGLFINTLPVRARLGPDETLVGWLQTLQAQQLEARQYEYTPLAQVRSWSDIPGGQPLFESLVVFENYPVDENILPDLGELQIIKARSLEVPSHPLNLVAIPSDRLTLRILYNQERFSAATIGRLLGHLHTLLNSMAQQPQARLGDLSLLTEPERVQLLTGWNKTRSPYPHDRSVPELFEEQAARTPETIAVDFPDTSLTYRELNGRANQLAHYLRRQGVRPGDLVGICLERSAGLVVAMLAVLKAGGAYVPLDPAYPAERLALMVEDTGTAVILTHVAQTVSLSGNGVAALPAIVYLDQAREAIAQMPSGNPLSGRVPASSPAYVMYTSGSTGRPKGITISHQAINRLLFNTNYISLRPDDVIAQAANASFDAATFEIWGALLYGALLVGIPQETLLSPRALAEMLHEKEVTVLFLTTALFNQVAADAPWAFGALRYLLFGGQAVEPRWVQAVLQTAPPERLLHVYGPTESTTFATWHLVEAVAEEAKTIPIGRPLANTQTYVLDRQLHPVPMGVPGELYIGGDGLAQGYFNRPALTALAFIPDPLSGEAGARLYKTGDLVRLGNDGHITFIGRMDNQVKIRGFRIEPGEIEAALGRHPAVGEMFVQAREDGQGQKHLAAYIVPSASPPPASADLRAFLEEKLPPYMVPTSFIFLDALPLNPNGKVDHRALPKPNGAIVDRQQPFTPPRTAVEEALAQAWAEVLNVAQVGTSDDFFELGGHSLKATQVAGRLSEALEIELPLRYVFEYPTIAALAEAVEDLLLSHLEAMSEAEAAELMPAVEPLPNWSAF